jgi:hypothetical protein
LAEEYSTEAAHRIKIGCAFFVDLVLSEAKDALHQAKKVSARKI